jgi:hypothetical protein
MRADAQMEGFQAGPAAAFDWTRDAAQRRMLQEAKHRGADIFEAFSVSPPYWMTVSGSSGGGTVAHQDNLRADMHESFVTYLATVVRHFRDAEGVRFESLEAFNEPDLSWMAGGRQEGYSASYSSQNRAHSDFGGPIETGRPGYSCIGRGHEQCRRCGRRGGPVEPDGAFRARQAEHA